MTHLEEMLAAAKAGKIRSLAIVACATEREVWTGIFGEPHPYVLLGGLEDVKYELLTKHIERL